MAMHSFNNSVGLGNSRDEPHNKVSKLRDVVYITTLLHNSEALIIGNQNIESYSCSHHRVPIPTHNHVIGKRLKTHEKNHHDVSNCGMYLTSRSQHSEM